MAITTINLSKNEEYFYKHAQSFKKAFYILLKSNLISEDYSHKPEQMNPLLSVLRHYIELMLKYILIKKHFSVKKLKGHDLKVLYSKNGVNLSKKCKENIDLINYDFRYPTNTDGEMTYFSSWKMGAMLNKKDIKGLAKSIILELENQKLK